MYQSTNKAHRIEEARHYAKSLPRSRPDLACPTCGEARALTYAEARRGYQCRNCADLEEFF